MVKEDVVLLHVEARHVQCHRCGYKWLYTGKSQHFISCSKCRTTITINPKHKRADVER